MRMKTLYTKDAERTGISRFPNFHKTGSITGMKELYYGKNALALSDHKVRVDIMDVRR